MVALSLGDYSMGEHTSAGTGKRKRVVTHCNDCAFQGQQTLADFVHLYWASDLGPVGLCW